MNRTILRVTLSLFIATIACLSACDNGITDFLPGFGQTQPMQRRTLHHDGIEREFFIHTPANVGDSTMQLPVVVAMHGYTSTATGFQAAYNLNSHADKHGYIVVYPQGSHFGVDEPDGTQSLITSWNDLAANQAPSSEGPHCTIDSYDYPCPSECGECNQCGWTSCYDDVGFIDRMLNEVQTEFSPDPERIYLLGVANGGMMALRLGCNLSSRFAAVAPINAQLAPGYACGPQTNLPILHIYGGEDNTVRADGRPGNDGFMYTTAARTSEVWANAMSCKTGPKPWGNEYSTAIGLSCTAYSDCEDEGMVVASCNDPDEQHEWPGQRIHSISPTCVAPEQTDSLPGQAPCPTESREIAHQGMDLVWDFMSRYRKNSSLPMQQ